MFVAADEVISRNCSADHSNAAPVESVRIGCIKPGDSRRRAFVNPQRPEQEAEPALTFFRFSVVYWIATGGYSIGCHPPAVVWLGILYSLILFLWGVYRLFVWLTTKPERQPEPERISRIEPAKMGPPGPPPTPQERADKARQKYESVLRMLEKAELSD